MAAALAQASKRLAEAGCGSPRVDAELLLAHVLRTSRAGLYAESRKTLTSEEASAFESLVDRRARREPLAYVLGEWGFRRLVLEVDSRVLVPRPETEIVVERCLAAIRGLPDPCVLDVGTGSGAIALAIAHEHPGARVTGLDSSEDALSVARKNVARTGSDVTLLHRDLFTGLPEGPWELVVCNPPYVSQHDVDRLDPEVREWEPRAALVGEGTTEAVADFARDVLGSGAMLVLETADGKAGQVAELLRGLGYDDLLVTQDLAGRDRVVEARRP